MQTHGLVRGFGNYTPAQTKQMKTDLALDMPLSALSYCASYYRNTARRDPYIEELKLLDRFWIRRAASVSSLAPIHLYTNDDFAAQTYADLMQKRRELMPQVTYPATLSESAGLCNAYLKRAGKYPSLGGQCILLQDLVHSALSPTKDGITLPNCRFALHTLPLPSAAPVQTDLFLLLLPAPGLSDVQKSKLQRSFLTDPTVQAQIKDIQTVEESGILQSLLALSDGLWIDLSALSRTGEPISATMLAQGYEGYYIIRIAAEAHESFFKAARKHDLYAMAFASPTADTTVTVLREKEFSFKLDSSFLRSLTPIKTAGIKLVNEQPYTASAISHLPATKNRCLYLSEQRTPISSQAVARKDLLIAAASTELEESSFQNALECALTPVLTLAASGCAFETQTLSMGIEAPLSDARSPILGKPLSALLGVYRLQAELALPMPSRMISTSEQGNTSLTVFSTACGRIIPDTFCEAGNFVYCISPVWQANGMPNFSELRGFLNALTSLSQRGAVKSARVLAKESLTDGLRQMAANGFACRVTNGSFLFDDMPRLSVIIETTERIKAPMLGKVEARLPEKSNQPIYALPERECLISSQSPCVTLLANPRDTDAAVLADTLTENGAQVFYLSPEPSNSPMISQAILSSSTLILCGKISLPKTDEVRFAAETLNRADGWILALGGAKCGLPLKVILPENGISRKMIDQICKKCK